MGRRTEYTFFQRKQTKGQQVHEKVGVQYHFDLICKSKPQNHLTPVDIIDLFAWSLLILFYILSMSFRNIMFVFMAYSWYLLYWRICLLNLGKFVFCSMMVPFKPILKLTLWVSSLPSCCLLVPPPPWAILKLSSNFLFLQAISSGSNLRWYHFTLCWNP